MEDWRSHSCSSRPKPLEEQQPSSVPSCLIGSENARAPPGTADVPGVCHASTSGWTTESTTPMAMQSLNCIAHSNRMGSIRHQGMQESISRNDEVAMQVALEATLNQQHMVQAVLQVTVR